MKKPSAMGYAMQQPWIPNTMVLDYTDDVFLRNARFFTDRIRGSEAILNAVHFTEELIRREMQCT